MSEKAPPPPAGRGGSGRGGGGGGRKGGRGGGGRGKGRGGKGPNKEKPAEVDAKAASSSSSNNNNNPNQAKPKQQQQHQGRGGGGRGGDGNKPKRNRNNNKGKGGGAKGGNKAQEKAPPQKSEEEKKREEEEQKAREEAEALEKRREEERKALEKAQVARRKEQEALDQKFKEATDALQALAESTQQHKANRAALEPEALAKARKEFQNSKKSLKTDLKKCTAFVKKAKTGTAWSMKPDEIKRDVSTLNLSRYVEEVVAALVEGKFKVVDLPAVVTLSLEMHLRYEEFLRDLLPGLWNVINGKATEDTAKNRKLHLRLMTDFVLNGLVTDTKQLVKLITEASGGKDENYMVSDAGLLVAFGKAAGHEIFGKRPRSIQSHIALIQKEAERASNEAAASTDAGVNEGGERGQAESEAAPTMEQIQKPVVVPLDMAEAGLYAVNKVEGLMSELAVTPEVSDTLSKHCLGAYETLSKSLVDTHTKLQKLEKRCEQDRLLSGSLTEAREKGLTDAKKLLESLQKSVDTFSDVLDQPLPQLEVEGKNDDDENGGVGLELWTKGGGEGENDFGPFDDEETRAFYCDIPDLLTTVPRGLLGISAEEVERRKTENLQKYGTGYDTEIVDDGESPEEVTFASEAQLEAEEAEAMAGAQALEEGGKAFKLLD